MKAINSCGYYNQPVLPILVDDEWYDQLRQHIWRLRKGPHTYYAYRTRTQDEKELGYPGCILMHREIMGLIKAGRQRQVDHKDRNGLNNQSSNLRPCTAAENTRNTTIRSKSSIYRGVYPNRSKTKFTAAIHSGKRIKLGIYDTETDAALAYNEAALLYHGEFATLNQI